MSLLEIGLWTAANFIMLATTLWVVLPWIKRYGAVRLNVRRTQSAVLTLLALFIIIAVLLMFEYGIA